MRIGIVVLAVTVGTLAAGVASSAARTGLSGPPSGPDPDDAEWPNWPYQTSCGYLPFDPVTAFSGPTDAEFGSGPAEAALREFLEEPGLPWLKPHLWRRISNNGKVAEFVRGRVSGSLEWLAVGPKDGNWDFWSYSSDCEPTSIVGKGPVVAWDLAPQKKPLRKWVRCVRVDLGPGPCSSGRPQNPRARATFQPLGNKLLMIVWLRPLPPDVSPAQGSSSRHSW